jgi:predicted metalloprotease with PDZ domain
VLAELPADVKLGLTVESVEKLSLREKEEFGATVKGLYITNIMSGSPADDAQVKTGLRVVRLRVSGGAWQDVTTKMAFDRLEKTLAPGARVLMQLKDQKDVSIYKLLVVPGTSEVKEAKTVTASAG